MYYDGVMSHREHGCIVMESQRTWVYYDGVHREHGCVVMES